jgi:hypothetical protein
MRQKWPKKSILHMIASNLFQPSCKWNLDYFDGIKQDLTGTRFKKYCIVHLNETEMAQKINLACACFQPFSNQLQVESGLF